MYRIWLETCIVAGWKHVGEWDIAPGWKLPVRARDLSHPVGNLRLWIAYTSSCEGRTRLENQRSQLEETSNRVGMNDEPGWKPLTHRVGRPLAPGWK